MVLLVEMSGLKIVIGWFDCHILVHLLNIVQFRLYPISFLSGVSRVVCGAHSAYLHLQPAGRIWPPSKIIRPAAVLLIVVTVWPT